MARGTECFAHVHRSKVPIEDHHVHPLGYGGPDRKSNKRKGCANAHSDTHYLLEDMLKGRKVDKREWAPGVREVAEAGYRAVIAHGEALVREIEERLRGQPDLASVATPMVESRPWESSVE